MAPARGRVDDRWREALTVVHGGPDWEGAGHPGAEPSLHAGRQAPAVQAVQTAVPPTSWRGHRQAGELSDGQVLCDALGRPQESQGTENSHQPTRRREPQVNRCKSAGQAQRFLSAHNGINNFFLLHRQQVPTVQYRAARSQAFQVGPRPSASPLRRNHGRAILSAHHRDLGPRSSQCRHDSEAICFRSPGHR